MHALEIETMIDVPLALGESPVWDDHAQRLWFADITEQLIFRLDPVTRAIARFPMPSAVASLGLAAGGKLVVALRTGVHLFDPASGRLDFLVHPEPAPASNRLNDGRVGPDGNFWVGSMDDRPDRQPVAALYRVTPQGASRRILGGLRCSNGLAWSPDGATMYHADSTNEYVQTFAFDKQTGEASNPRPFIRLNRQDGLPDGAAVDEEGYYWSAGVTAGVLHRISAQGQVVARIALPVAAPTMPCFGGADRQTLFVTSLATERAGVRQAGTVIAFRVATRGLPSNRFGEIRNTAQ